MEIIIIALVIVVILFIKNNMTYKTTMHFANKDYEATRAWIHHEYPRGTQPISEYHLLPSYIKMFLTPNRWTIKQWQKYVDKKKVMTPGARGFI